MVAEFPRGRKGLWVVASPAAKEQTLRRLATGSGSPLRATVWTWDDLWVEVRRRAGEGPTLLSREASRAVLGEAIEFARIEGRLRALGSLIESPGFRERLAGRVASWTRSGVAPEANRSSAAPIDEAEHAVYARYRGLLRNHGMEDRDGLAEWASRRLLDDPPPAFQAPLRIRVPTAPNSPQARKAVRILAARVADSLVVAVRDRSGPDDGEAPASDLVGSLLESGFRVERVEPEPGPSPALAHLVAHLFREPEVGPCAEASGLDFVGACEGKGEALAVASAVKARLDLGAPAREIAAICATDGALADEVDRTLRSWGIPTCKPTPRRIAQDARVAAWRQAMSLPIEGWDADRLARFLRHGAVRPSWSFDEGSLAVNLAGAAAAVTEARVFRGAKEILRSLKASAYIPDDDPNDPDRRVRQLRARRALAAIPQVERLVELLQPVGAERTWDEWLVYASAAAGGLGLAGPAIEAGMLALEDHGAILHRLGLRPPTDRPGRIPWAGRVDPRDPAS